jgi:hypothetical protein
MEEDMLTPRTRIPVPLAACLLALGCGRSDTPVVSVPGEATVTVDSSKLLLGAAPGGAAGVLKVREDAKDGDEVVIAGRIGGNKKPIGAGLAFTLVDQSLKSCADNGEDTATPWDFC